MNKSLMVGILFFATNGFAFADSKLEPVRLVSMHQDYNWTGDASTTPTVVTMSVAVASNGCTYSRDFKIDVDVVGKTQEIKIVRVTPDDCKGTFENAEIHFTTTRLKLANFYPIVIENPILPTGVNLQPGETLRVEK